MAILSCHVSIKLPPKISDGQVISMGRLPCVGVLRNQDKMPRNREEADLFFCSVTPLQNVRNENFDVSPLSWPRASSQSSGWTSRPGLGHRHAVSGGSPGSRPDGQGRADGRSALEPEQRVADVLHSGQATDAREKWPGDDHGR